MNEERIEVNVFRVFRWRRREGRDRQQEEVNGRSEEAGIDVEAK